MVTIYSGEGEEDRRRPVTTAREATSKTVATIIFSPVKKDAYRLTPNQYLYETALTKFLGENNLLRGKAQRYMPPGSKTWKKKCSECSVELYFGGEHMRHGGGSKFARHSREHCYNIPMNAKYHATRTVPHIAQKYAVSIPDALCIFRTLVEDPPGLARELEKMLDAEEEGESATGGGADDEPNARRFLAIYRQIYESAPKQLGGETEKLRN